MDARLGAEDVATGTVRARQIPVRQGVIEPRPPACETAIAICAELAPAIGAWMMG